MSVDREDLDRLEESMYDCWNITSDIQKILDVSDNIEDDVRAVSYTHLTLPTRLSV